MAAKKYINFYTSHTIQYNLITPFDFDAFTLYVRIFVVVVVKILLYLLVFDFFENTMLFFITLSVVQQNIYLIKILIF